MKSKTSLQLGMLVKVKGERCNIDGRRALPGTIIAIDSNGFFDVETNKGIYNSLTRTDIKIK